MGNDVQKFEESKSLTTNEIRASVNLIQDVLQHIMKKDVHYGVVPGCGIKPALLKPGAEKILMTFRIAAKTEVEDLSKLPEYVRYRVKVDGLTIPNGAYVGTGIGECSSDEEKYKWKKAYKEDYDATTEDRRRKKNYRDKTGKVVEVLQIRQNPLDISNTVLKMAKKRGLVDLALTATAASDIFEQDIEEMEPEQLQEREPSPKASVQTPQPKSPAPAATTATDPRAAQEIQFKKARAILGEEKFLNILGNEGYESVEDIPSIAVGEKILEAMRVFIKDSK